MPTSSEDSTRQTPLLSERPAHHRVPGGYFDDLSTRILSQIPLDESVTGDQCDGILNARQCSRSWMRLCPWVAIAAALIVVVALWSVWRGDVQEPLRSDNEVASSVYDLNVTPLTDAEYADCLYETCVDILLGDYVIGETMGTLSEDEM